MCLCFNQADMVKTVDRLWSRTSFGTATAVFAPSNSKISSLSRPSSVGRGFVHSVPNPGEGKRSTLFLLAPLKSPFSAQSLENLFKKENFIKKETKLTAQFSLTLNRVSVSVASFSNVRSCQADSCQEFCDSAGNLAQFQRSIGQ